MTDSLFQLNSPLQMRWATPENFDALPHVGGQTNFGRKGSSCRGKLAAGETWDIAHAQGTGTIRRIWITLDRRTPDTLRGVVFRAYWDGADKPAIEVPLGDFFANPLGRNLIFESEWFNNTEGRCFNTFLPMPFRKSFRMTVTNESPADIAMFWYHVDFTLGDPHDQHTGYLHASWNRENPTTLRRDFQILPRVQGRGRYLGCNLGVVTDPKLQGFWWGEGEIKIYLDGDSQFPTLCGTGAEDYICTAWGQGVFKTRWYGCHLADHERGQYAQYRFHGPDPIFFRDHCRVTIQQIGWTPFANLLSAMREGRFDRVTVAGDGTQVITREQLEADPQLQKAQGLFERQDDFSATAYFYLDRPSSDLPALAPYESRVANLTGDAVAIKRQDV